MIILNKKGFFSNKNTNREDSRSREPSTVNQLYINNNDKVIPVD